MQKKDAADRFDKIYYSIYYKDYFDLEDILSEEEAWQYRVDFILPDLEYYPEIDFNYPED